MFGSAMDTELVHLIVGEDEHQRRLEFDRKLLCAKVPFLQAMFNGHFPASDGEAHLPTDRAGAVEQLLSILLYDAEAGIARLPHAGGRSQDGESWNPFELYALARKWCLLGILDEIMDTLLWQHFWNEELPAVAFIRETYDRAPGNSMLRKYVLWAVRFARGEGIPCGGEQEWREFLEDYPDFEKDLQETVPTQELDPRALLNRCEFHLHDAENPCRGRRLYNRRIQ
ncbi:hypothetical protein BJ875DRAFT_267965 [Amylocarpus encephaloides]|uniref:BTB domain-containing protein n=1 Tax=Amylocarpus encephaloides TaxID=45428 RepID=A0A9P7YM72_9HELO|nr:hypothetical protein BJ875DRAFT_267965 [Amylocarpus encephaloides]